MKRVALFIIAVTSTLVVAQHAPKRPKITGIDHVDFYTTDAAANERLYTVILGLSTADPVEPAQTQRFIVGKQWVGYSPAPDHKTTNRMDHVAFRTDDCEALRVYLGANGITVPNGLETLKTGERSFRVKDPEGNAIEFLQPTGGQLMKMHVAGKPKPFLDPVSRRLIHTGFVVHDRAAEDHFYEDILGFHLYWYGGMKPERTEWMAMQVPDGTDWLEYMLNVKPGADLHTTGVMNHISIGVTDMKVAQAKLEAHGWKPHGDEHSQMGRDGKWQLNIFDPDQTRVELMEFTPKEKPCCSEFQGKHPSEND
jgi:catechol 2,3-dioxygenase-like lactoylglutathione lyase family enzyme